MLRLILKISPHAFIALAGHEGPTARQSRISSERPTWPQGRLLTWY
jgi:hypothetical protein